MGLKVVRCILFCFILLAACHPEVDDSKQNDVIDEEDIIFSDDGYQIYKENSCINCHGDQLQGASGPSLLDIDLTADEIEAIIVNGVGFMPPQDLDEEDRRALVEWLSAR